MELLQLHTDQVVVYIGSLPLTTALSPAGGGGVNNWCLTRDSASTVSGTSILLLLRLKMDNTIYAFKFINTSGSGGKYILSSSYSGTITDEQTSVNTVDLDLVEVALGINAMLNLWLSQRNVD